MGKDSVISEGLAAGSLTMLQQGQHRLYFMFMCGFFFFVFFFVFCFFEVGGTRVGEQTLENRVCDWDM
jgi:hypothetical protein